jgi:hypothetical protein
MTDPMAQGLNELCAALTTLGIRFLVSGSLASSAHGVVRATSCVIVVSEENWSPELGR